jgi:hypothetical protein
LTEEPGVVLRLFLDDLAITRYSLLGITPPRAGRPLVLARGYVWLYSPVIADSE